jgi:hypothetical protein
MHEKLHGMTGNAVNGKVQSVWRQRLKSHSVVLLLSMIAYLLAWTFAAHPCGDALIRSQKKAGNGFPFSTTFPFGTPYNVK